MVHLVPLAHQEARAEAVEDSLEAAQEPRVRETLAELVDSSTEAEEAVQEQLAALAERVLAKLVEAVVKVRRCHQQAGITRTLTVEQAEAEAEEMEEGHLLVAFLTVAMVLVMPLAWAGMELEHTEPILALEAVADITLEEAELLV